MFQLLGRESLIRIIKVKLSCGRFAGGRLQDGEFYNSAIIIEATNWIVGGGYKLRFRHGMQLF